MRVWEIATFISAALAGVILLLGVGGAAGAPQEAAAAAIALALVAIPYCVSATLQRRELVRLLRVDRLAPRESDLSDRRGTVTPTASDPNGRRVDF
jgi:membrane protein implicated in regulation of membrane protease activity